VGFRIPQTSALMNIHPVQRSSEALPTNWVEVRGSLTVVRLERMAVAVGVGTDEFQGTGQEAVDNTEVPEEVAGES